MTIRGIGKMPVYEFQCLKCKEIFERIKPMLKCLEDDVCPECGSKAKKIFSVPTRYKGQKGNWNR